MIPAKKVFQPDMISNLNARFNSDRANRSYNNKNNNRQNNTILTTIPVDSVDYYIVKPIGKKCYLWFSYIDKQFVAIIKYPYDSRNNNNNRDYNDNLDNLFIADIGFNNTLSYNNVLLYGYYVEIEGQSGKSSFVIDNVINYNDYNYILNDTKAPLLSVFKIYNKIFENIHPVTTGTQRMQIFLPFISDDYDKVFSSIYNLAYRPYGISVWSRDKNLGIYPLKNQNDVCEAIFRIEANPNHDTYDLYCQNGNRVEFYNRCLITDYRLSVYMNSLFRNIVENQDLDLLEESEDEEDFENIDEYRFVDLNRSLYFRCQYNKRFKKWVPRTLIENGKPADLITRKQLLYIAKK